MVDALLAHPRAAPIAAAALRARLRVLVRPRLLAAAATAAAAAAAAAATAAAAAATAAGLALLCLRLSGARVDTGDALACLAQVVAALQAVQPLALAARIPTIVMARVRSNAPLAAVSVPRARAGTVPGSTALVAHPSTRVPLAPLRLLLASRGHHELVPTLASDALWLLRRTQ